MSTVSTWSSALCAVAMSPGWADKKPWRSARAASSRLSPVSLARLAASPRPTARGTPHCLHKYRTNASSPSDSSPRRQWLKCAAVREKPSSSESVLRQWSSATESAPPETAQTRALPGESPPGRL